MVPSTRPTVDRTLATIADWLATKWREPLLQRSASTERRRRVQDRRVDGGRICHLATPGVEIHNPQLHRVAVAFVLDGEVITLQPGETVDSRYRPAQVVFDRGRGGGVARQTLTPGYFEFTVTAKGWHLEQPPVD